MLLLNHYANWVQDSRESGPTYVHMEAWLALRERAYRAMRTIREGGKEFTSKRTNTITPYVEYKIISLKVLVSQVLLEVIFLSLSSPTVRTKPTDQLAGSIHTH